jgi:hypothetical protein
MPHRQSVIQPPGDPRGGIQLLLQRSRAARLRVYAARQCFAPFPRLCRFLLRPPLRRLRGRAGRAGHARSSAVRRSSAGRRGAWAEAPLGEPPGRRRSTVSTLPAKERSLPRGRIRG